MKPLMSRQNIASEAEKELDDDQLGAMFAVATDTESDQAEAVNGESIASTDERSPEP